MNNLQTNVTMPGNESLKPLVSITNSLILIRDK